MEQHFTKHIFLDQICRQTGLSRSTLPRAFTKLKGITPYRYLESIHINEAKSCCQKVYPRLMQQLKAGFSDYSHLWYKKEGQ